MGKTTGFIETKRQESGYRPVKERVSDFAEVELALPEKERQAQASRCMDCGVAFCHWSCSVSNVMPEWQDYVYKGDWAHAYENLSSTNNFPEFTGRVCPALCEASCVLGINDEPVTIRENELAVIEKAFALGIVKPRIPSKRSGKNVAVVGSGPAGLAAADQLNQAGHTVTIFEKDDRIGGYLRYGIPDFKLDKKIIDRRLDLLRAEGIEFKTSVNIGHDTKGKELLQTFDATILAIGARDPRDLKVPGRELNGVHFALDYLTLQNKSIAGDFSSQSLVTSHQPRIDAKGKHVVVIGGGDTGSDCVGTANRQGALSVTQIEIMPQPPETRSSTTPWPQWPYQLKTSSSHKEGCDRMWNVLTKKFLPASKAQTPSGAEVGLCVGHLECIKVEWLTPATGGRPEMREIPGSEFTLAADLVLLALGFVQPVRTGLVEELGVKLDNRGNIAVHDNGMTSIPGVFACGDASRGASLVVWGIATGRDAAEAVNQYLHQKH